MGGVLSALWGAPLDASKEAAEFRRSFEGSYGHTHPEFYVGGFREAWRHAHSSYRFLAVYLHSGCHKDTDAMCRDVLCNGEAAGYLTENFVVWAGDVSQPEAYTLSTQMGATGFPFLAVFLCKGTTPEIPYLLHRQPEDPQLRSLGVEQPTHPLLLKLDQGPAVHDVDKLLPQLRKLVDDESIQLTAIRLEHEERTMSRSMREEQDAAYAEAEREDEEKERVRQEVADEAERAEQQVADYASMREAQVAERQHRQLPEPEPGTGQARVLVRALDGSRITRRFDELSTLQAIFDWVDATSAEPLKRSGDFKLVCSYPRLLFNMEEHRCVLEI